MIIITFWSNWLEFVEYVWTLVSDLFSDSLDMDVTFEKGERLNLNESEGASHKYTIEQLRYLTKKAHLNIHQMWTNEHVAMLLLCKENFIS